MKYTIAIITTLVMMHFFAGKASSFNGGYSPGYEPFGAAKLYNTKQCKVSASTDALTTFICNEDKKEQWTITMHTEKDTPIFVLSKFKGNDYRFVMDASIPPRLDEVYMTDLNKDGIPDFILVSPGGGCGLASEFCAVTFILSNAKGYVPISMQTMGFGPEDIIDYYGKNTPTIIHTSFIDGDTGKDRKIHNYWVYNFFKVDGTQILTDYNLQPRWIMFDDRINHQPTQQLTNEQKEMLWSKQHRPFFLNKQTK